MTVGAASWSFTEDDHAVITRTLNVFLADSNSRCALLVDRAGQLVATVGEQPRFDATTFATLTAADFSANDQLARLVGETEFSALVADPMISLLAKPELVSLPALATRLNFCPNPAVNA